MAYYGGRFEITRVGHIAQEVFEYDIRSAYPAAMRELPCLEHGTWKEATARKELRKHNGLYVAACSFKAACDKGGFGQLGAFPVRSKEGHLYWPLQGAGVYWSVEVNSARQMGYSIRFVHGWTYHRNCDCHPFDWVEPLFDYRRSIGAQGPGYPIKLGINSLYGLLAQRKGTGRFVNMVWAGLITAITRSRMNDVIALNPGRIVMIATDAIYSLDPLDTKGLDIGERLGQWEKTELQFAVHRSTWIVLVARFAQEEISWTVRQVLRGSWTNAIFRKRMEVFLSARELQSINRLSCRVCSCAEFYWIEVGALTKQARDSGHLDQRPSLDIVRLPQQATGPHTWQGDHILTRPKLGYPGLKSLPHRDFLKGGGAEPWEAARSMLEEQPDWIDMGIPFKD